jgi:hypothetical protein
MTAWKKIHQRYDLSRDSREDGLDSPADFSSVERNGWVSRSFGLEPSIAADVRFPGRWKLSGKCSHHWNYVAAI